MRDSLQIMLLACILGAIFFFAQPTVVWAQTEVTVSCTNLDDPLNTCSIDPPISPITSLVKTLSDINTCEEESAGGRTICSTASGESFVCENTEQGVECTFPDTTTITCAEISENSASCRITQPDQADIDEVLRKLSVTPPQAEIARVLALVCSKRNVSAALQRDCDLLVGNALSGDTEAAKAALASITPDGASAPVDAAQTSLSAQTRNISGRLAELRKGTSGVSISGLLLEQYGQQLYPQNALRSHSSRSYSPQNPRGGGAGEDPNASSRLGVFVNGTLSVGEKDDSQNERGFDLNGVDITAGVDYRFADEYFAGLAFGYSNSGTTLNASRGKLDVDTYTLVLYGTYYPSQQFYVDGSLSYSGNDFSQERNIRYTLLDPITMTNVNVNQTASADFFGGQLALNLSAGYELTAGGLTYGPFGRIQYVGSEVDNYSEQMSSPDAPGSGWAINVDSQNYHSLISGLGGKASYAVNRSWGVLVPQASIEWNHEFKDDIHVVTGKFIGDPNNEKFRLPTDAPDANYMLIGAGVSTVFPQGRTAYIYYERLVGFNDFNRYAISAGGRWEF